MFTLYTQLHNWFYNVTFNAEGWGFWYFGAQSFYAAIIATFIFLAIWFYELGLPDMDDEDQVICICLLPALVAGLFAWAAPFFVFLIPIVFVFWKALPWFAATGERNREKAKKQQAADEAARKEAERILSGKE